MELSELLDVCRAQAIYNTLVSTEISVWRKICRNYSERFSTPLYMCLDGTISPEEIILAEFESQLDNYDEEKDLEHILEQIYKIEDPEYDKAAEQEVENFMKKVEKEERERLKAGKPIHKSIKNIQKEVNQKNTFEKSEEILPERKGGYLNLSHLTDNETESGDF